MNDIEIIINRIRLQSARECEAIAKDAEQECERLRVEYARREQEEYWKAINVGTNEAEQRLTRLTRLAEQEAQKQIDATHAEKVSEAFALAAEKLAELPEYADDRGAAFALIKERREELSPLVEAMLFD
jgi:hypothetical protein